MLASSLQSRIAYQGDLANLLKSICKDYQIDTYKTHSINAFGYEDFNVTVEVDKGTYFVKIFAKSRDRKECQRYIEILSEVGKADISFPKLYKSSQGFLHTLQLGSATVFLCVMKYINGKTFFELEKVPSQKEMQSVIVQAAKINALLLKPSFLYDSWSTITLLKEYDRKKQYLSTKESESVARIVKEFSAIDIKQLDHCFVHGDMTRTNVMKDSKGKIYIIDFAVANYSPRIYEVATLICHLFFDVDNPSNFTRIYNFTVEEHQSYHRLDKTDLAVLPLFIKATFAAYLLAATFEKSVLKNNTNENEYWLKASRIGLHTTEQM